MDAKNLIKDLEKRGYDYFTGLPDSLNGEIVNELIRQKKWHYSTDEPNAIAQAYAAHLVNKKPYLILSSAGFLHCLNEIMGLFIAHQTTLGICLSVRNEPYHHFHEYYLVQEIVNNLYLSIDFYIVRDRDYPLIPLPQNDSYTIMKTREEIIDIILKKYPKDIIICGVGYTGRYIYHQHNQRKTLFFPAGMGSAQTIAHQLALYFPHKRFVLIMGDGEAIMNSYLRNYTIPPNLTVHILCNGAYSSTGNQQITFPPLFDFPDEAFIYACDISYEYPYRFGTIPKEMYKWRMQQTLLNQ